MKSTFNLQKHIIHRTLLGSLAPHEKTLQHWTQRQPLLAW